MIRRGSPRPPPLYMKEKMTSLTETQKIEICDLHQKGMRPMEIAKIYDKHISSIISLLQRRDVYKRFTPTFDRDVYNETYRKAHPENRRRQGRRNHLKTQYGLSEKDYDLMLKEQNNQCKICNEEFKERPHIDHNHKTGKVRGLLCGSCNHGLGHFKDSVKVLKSAIAYMEISEC